MKDNQTLKCPYCESNNTKTHGKTANGTQRYICNECLKSFADLSNTLTINRKKN